MKPTLERKETLTPSEFSNSTSFASICEAVLSRERGQKMEKEKKAKKKERDPGRESSHSNLSKSTV
jgi:hypothetical protein